MEEEGRRLQFEKKLQFGEKQLLQFEEKLRFGEKQRPQFGEKQWLQFEEMVMLRPVESRRPEEWKPMVD